MTVTADAGWSSPVARQAHNLKVVGSNPAPATKLPKQIQCFTKTPRPPAGAFLRYRDKLGTVPSTSINESQRPPTP